MEIQGVEHAELAENLGMVLARLYGFLRRAILPEGMSLTQALALGTLRDLGPQRVTDLADLEGVRQPTCTGIVNAMEAQGWVARRSNDADRRAVLVELTTEGRRTLQAITDARTGVLDLHLRELSESERKALAAALPGLTKLIELGGAAEREPSTHTAGP
jgi:DNA-binding MarR family transcriptional regulator